MAADHESAPARIELHRFDDKSMPGDHSLPLVIYRGALALDGHDPGEDCEALFARNGWGGAWQDGIYPYHHFHATTHEALGIVRGAAQVRFGGEGGSLIALRAGDVVVIPAGLSHKNEGASSDLLVVGAYPGEREPDIRKGVPSEHRQASDSLRRVPAPAADPVFGRDGPLLRHWSAPSGG
jgi:uncharacterized protein YjlB